MPDIATASPCETALRTAPARHPPLLYTRCAMPRIRSTLRHPLSIRAETKAATKSAPRELTTIDIPAEGEADVPAGAWRAATALPSVAARIEAGTLVEVAG